MWLYEEKEITFGLQVRFEETLHPVKGNDVHPVVQVGMGGSGHNEKFFVVPREFLEGVFAEIA